MVTDSTDKLVNKSAISASIRLHPSIKILNMFNKIKIFIPFTLAVLLAGISVFSLCLALSNSQEAEKPQVLESSSGDIKVGERLEYMFNYIGIPAVRLIFEVKEITKVDDIDCYRVVATARPRKIFALFRNIGYEVETYIDMKTYKPLKFHKRKIHGRKITDEFIDFHFKDGIALWKYSGLESKEVRFEQNTQDLVSLLYYFRCMDIQKGKGYPVSVLYNGVLWPVTIKIGDIERLTRAGKRTSVISVEPVSELVRYLMKDEKALLYFSNDSKRIPLIFKIYSKTRALMGTLRYPPA